MEFEILDKERVFNQYLKIDAYQVQHERYATKENANKNIEVAVKGDACAALVYETDSKSILLIEQFRLPAAIHGNGWITELIAGTMEENEGPRETMKREILEEIGYQVESLEFIQRVFVSPGWTTERINIYFATTNSTLKVSDGGGLESEQEDIQIIKIKLEQLDNFMESVHDAKTLIALQWFQWNVKKKLTI